jgi:hypothetical protein
MSRLRALAVSALVALALPPDRAVAAAAPTLQSVFPNAGPVGGGSSVTLTGSNFVAGATVTFGGVNATNVQVQSSTDITAITPPHASGIVDVVVTNTDLQFAPLAGGFDYTAAGAGGGGGSASGTDRAIGGQLGSEPKGGCNTGGSGLSLIALVPVLRRCSRRK